MEFVHIDREEILATVRLERGKVHALNDQVIDELSQAFRDLEQDDSIRAVILTGTGKFFSFGFDIDAGGMFGRVSAKVLTMLLSTPGAYMLALALVLSSIIMLSPMSLIQYIIKSRGDVARRPRARARGG